MYTQCPECNSIFEITATDLAVAGGFVRCGQCSSSFDALKSLSDNPDAIKASAATSKAKTALDKAKTKARPTVANKKARVPAKLARRKKTSRAKPTKFAGSALHGKPISDDTDGPAADVVLLADDNDNRSGKQDKTETDKIESPPDTNSDHAETELLSNDEFETLAGGELVVSDDPISTPDTDEKSNADVDADDDQDSDASVEDSDDEILDELADADEKAVTDPGSNDAGTVDIADTDVSTDAESADSEAADDPETKQTQASDDDPVSTSKSESDDSTSADGKTEDQDDSIADTTAAAAIEAYEDEILLDDTYQSPYSADDEVFFDDDQVDADDDAFEETLVPIEGKDGTSGVLEDEDEDYVPDDDQDDASDLGSIADEDQETNLAEETMISSDYDADDVDESVLFALPLPELTALEPGERGMLPEKLEGGEAACDPSAQTPITRAEPELSQSASLQSSPHLPQTNDAYDADDARDLKEYLKAPTNRWATATWLGGSVLMALLLLAQFVHRHRGDLVTHPRLGPVVSSIYDTVGADLRPNWQINRYEVVGQARLFLMPNDEAEEQGDEPASAIRFVSIITNSSNRPQPAPMVRLTLRDRWGDATGTRDFTPPEYLADRAMIGQMLEPGQRLRVVLNLRDQGSEAVGFDFDMCLPDGAGTLRCTSEDAG